MPDTLRPMVLAGLSGSRMLMPRRASCWARRSGENILMVLSIPEAAIVGSYGWPAIVSSQLVWFD